MATQQDIVAALKETLKRTGTLDNVRSILRADIYHSLNDSFDKKPKHTAPPKENILINELIADYLSFNGYHNTVSVLAAETGTPALAEIRNNERTYTDSSPMMLGENFIRTELGLGNRSNNISSGRRRKPMALLYVIVETLKARNRAKTS